MSAADPVRPDFEKLGAFYLGKVYDIESRTRGSEMILYDSKDLVTHAVCVGMTGSGKTGLCLSLLEEAAIDGIPAIVIDPKGDLANLLLTFPDLSPRDFRPWINEDDARKKGLSPDEFAARQAELWSRGLAEWGQDGARIRRLRDAADVSIYTPGSNAGLGVSVLRSFDAPSPEILDDNEALQDRINSTATSLLGLMNITAEPLQSREHILLSTILYHAWNDGESLDLAALIQRIQKPPVTRLGVMELETVFPSQDRFALAMQLNNLIASPGFSRWLEGDALDIASFLSTPAGKPRVSIFSISHLSDAERMFFVSLLLNQIVGWVRSQSGTTSLRAIVYMDEIAGYFPPVANPPSKKPLLTLMKQARAFGVGTVLATQNPVDLDYKGLANAGTWFIGRLQTDRDKQRVLDGLEGAAATASSRFDRARVDRLLSSLSTRVFLMNNIHEDEPVVFETRWAMSYLRGPLTRSQIRTLTDARRAATSVSAEAPSRGVHAESRVSGRAERASAPTGTGPTGASRDTPRDQPASHRSESLHSSSASSPRVTTSLESSREPGSPRGVPGASSRPVLPPEIPQYFVPARGADIAEYRPMALGIARVYYSDAKIGVETETSLSLLAEIRTGPVPVEWADADDTELAESDLEHDPPTTSAGFARLPTEAGKAKSYDAWKKSLTDAIFRSRTLQLLAAPELKIVAAPGEKEREFRLRLAQAVRERRDELAEKLRARYAPKLSTIQERLRRAEQQLDVQREQASQAKFSGVLSVGTAILGAFLGRKKITSGNIGRAATAAKGVGRGMRETGDVDRAEETVVAVRLQLTAIEEEFNAEVAALTAELESQASAIETVSVKPKKTNINVRAVVLAWVPHDRDGNRAI